MKKILLSLLYCFCLYFTTMGQPLSEQIVKSEIKHVTVFLNRAELTSSLRATVMPTTSKLIVENIPLSIDPNSIQVSGTGDAIITGVRFDRDYLKNAPRPARIVKLEDTLSLIQDELAAVELSASVLEEEKVLILANKQISGAAGAVKVVELKDMANFYRERLTEIGTKLLKLKERQAELKKREVRVKNQLADWQRRREQPLGVIEISISVKSRTQLSMELSYLVGGAGWSPYYDLRVANTQKPVTLAYKAKVYQNTGQNWENVKLTLSTANPAQGGTKPELTPQYVNFVQPISRQVRVATSAKSSQVEMYDAGAAPPSESVMKTTADYTEIGSNELSVLFEIALPYTIISGGEAQSVDISSYEVPATYRHFSVPKLDNDAFLMAQLTGWEKYNLLNGSANVYFEGTYLGQSQLITQNTKDTMTVSLGRDKRVIVKRERLNEFSSQRILGSNIRETLSYRITVRNTKPDIIKLTLEDQVPVSQNSDIELDLLEISNARYTAENGMLRWDINLKPNETRTFDIKFELKYPKGKTINY